MTRAGYAGSTRWGDPTCEGAECTARGRSGMLNGVARRRGTGDGASGGVLQAADHPYDWQMSTLSVEETSFTLS